MPSSYLSVVASILRFLRLPTRNATDNSGKFICPGLFLQVTNDLSDFFGWGSEPSTNTYPSSSTPHIETTSGKQGNPNHLQTCLQSLSSQFSWKLITFRQSGTLCRTSCQVDSIFTLNSDAILRDVTLRSPEAQQLASNQEVATSHPHSLSTHPAIAHNRNGRMLSSASAALRVLGHYEASVFKHSGQESHEHLSCRRLTPAEQTTSLPTAYGEETLPNPTCVEEELLPNPSCHAFHCREPKPFYHFTLVDGYPKEASPGRRPKL